MEKKALLALLSACPPVGSEMVSQPPVKQKPTGRDKYTEEQQQRKLEAAQAKRERKKAKRRKEDTNE